MRFMTGYRLAQFRTKGMNESTSKPKQKNEVTWNLFCSLVRIWHCLVDIELVNNTATTPMLPNLLQWTWWTGRRQRYCTKLQWRSLQGVLLRFHGKQFRLVGSKAVEAFVDGNDTSIKDRSLLLSRYVWRLVHSPLSTLQIISLILTVDEADNKKCFYRLVVVTYLNLTLT